MFIVFEGIDGSGKSTQARSLYRRLARLEQKVLLVHEPGGTPLGETVRRWVKTRQGLSSLAELFLFTAARSQVVADVIRPALLDGAVVIADRFAASTVAYQGYGRGMDITLINQVNREAMAGMTPDLTILLDVAPEVGAERKTARPNTRSIARIDKFDTAPLDFHRRVRQGYLDQAGSDPARWLVLDATAPPAQLSRDIWTKVKPLL